MNFQVGDQVRVTKRGRTQDPDGMGPGMPWLNSWTVDMDYSYHRVFTIEEIDPDAGVKFVGDEYLYPANVLKKEMH